MVALWVVARCSRLAAGYTNVSEHTASIFRADVKNVRKWMVYIGLGGGSDQGDWSSHNKSQDHHLYKHHRGNLKSYKILSFHRFTNYVQLP
jgi:hypothetical protein